MQNDMINPASVEIVRLFGDAMIEKPSILINACHGLFLVPLPDCDRAKRQRKGSMSMIT